MMGVLAATLEDLRQLDAIQRRNFKEQIEEMNEKTEDKKQLVEAEQSHFDEYKKQIAMGAVNSHSGKHIPLKVYLH